MWDAIKPGSIEKYRAFYRFMIFMGNSIVAKRTLKWLQGGNKGSSILMKINNITLMK